MDTVLSNTQIDRLGERLRSSDPSEADLRLLDQHRRSFSEPYEFVVSKIRTELGLQPTGRPAKSTASIREKLKRESLRFSQMQDIAGCRIVVEDIEAQDLAIENIRSLFSELTIADRRKQPSHGYRAVHVIVRISQKPIEVQIRTKLQHGWSEYSEKLSDVFDPAIKYGGGPLSIRVVLSEASNLVANVEASESVLLMIANRVWTGADQKQRHADIWNEVRESNRTMRVELEKFMQESIGHILESAGE